MTRKCAQKHREVFNAFCEGKPVQQRCPKEQTWYDTDDLRWDPDLTYRIKPSPSPKVPLGPRDVDLHRDLFRFNPGESQIASTVTPKAIWINSAVRGLSWKEAQKSLERSTNGGKTWQRAEKEPA